MIFRLLLCMGVLVCFTWPGPQACRADYWGCSYLSGLCAPLSLRTSVSSRPSQMKKAALSRRARCRWLSRGREATSYPRWRFCDFSRRWNLRKRRSTMMKSCPPSEAGSQCCPAARSRSVSCCSHYSPCTPAPVLYYSPLQAECCCDGSGSDYAVSLTRFCLAPSRGTPALVKCLMRVSCHRLSRSELRRASRRRVHF